MRKNNTQPEQTQYFVVKADKQQYKGERLFAFDFNSDRCFQVCVTQGEEKKGRSNTPGIYFINRLTFLGNYLAVGYVVPTTKAEYKKKFDEVMALLKMSTV